MTDRLIPPEILNDKFYRELLNIAKNRNLYTFLEIGSSSGEGSTHALVSGIRERSDKDRVKLFCMEISSLRFKELVKHYSEDSFVHCYNVSSVHSSLFPSKDEVKHFYRSVRTILRQCKEDLVLEWLKSDLDYLTASGRDTHGIREIKQEHEIKNFDFVLIDGSEFTGERELYEVMGARIIALDDIRAFKCWNAHQCLKSSTNYKLISYSKRTRNGYSIFERLF